MKTLSQALSWLNAQKGQQLNYDGLWGAQCVDLPRYYVDFLEEPQFSATPAAVDLWSARWPDGFFKHEGPAQVGDIVVFAGTNLNRYGHCGVITKILSPTKFESLDQNFYGFNLEVGSPAATVAHTTQNVLGYIRPRFIPEATPSGKPVPAPASAGTGIASFAIRANDTFWGLEVMWALEHGTLQALNPTVNPRNLQIGQVINVPANVVSQPAQPRRYVIQAGDTFWDLEQHFKWSHGTLFALNPGVNPRLLQIGQEINIPG